MPNLLWHMCVGVACLLRSFSPLVAPSQGLQSLSVRQGSFLCPRTHSVMGRSQAGVTAAAAVMRSAQSCYYTTTASWAGGNSGRESSLDRACLTSSAAAAAAAQESMHIGLGSSSSGISHARMHASASGHRLASMGHGGQEALCVLQAQQQHPSVTGADEKELQPSTQDASDDQLPGTVQAAAEGMQQHGPTFLLDAGLKVHMCRSWEGSGAPNTRALLRFVSLFTLQHHKITCVQRLNARCMCAVAVCSHHPRVQTRRV